MSHPDPRERARENASGIAAIVVTGVWLAAMMAGFEYWLPLMLFGYVVVPIAGLLFDEDEEPPAFADAQTGAVREDAGADEDDALARLRERYADDELTDEQFERKVECLLETDTLENVEDRRRARGRELERETEFE